MKNPTGKEQRKHLRIGLIVDIEMTLPLKGIVNVRTRNISDGGLFLILDNIEMPTVGTEVQVRLKNQLGDGEEPPINRARVVRHESDGIGLEFLD
ncbi:MAG TPA: PilZ domain-containing protein [Gammaproteobacteria bacterium]